MFTKDEIQVLGGAFLGFIFLIGLLWINPKDAKISTKYKRIDYIGSLIFISLAIIAELFYILSTNKAYFFRSDLLSVVCLGLLFFYSGAINVHFRKEINNDTAYKFGVSFFICGWICIFYVIAEFLR